MIVYLLFRIEPALFNSFFDSTDVLLHILTIKLSGLSIGWAIRVRVMEEALDRGEDCSNVVSGRPSILEDVETEFAACIDIWVEHSGEEFHGRWLVRIRFFKCQQKFECAVFKWGVSWTKYDSIPKHDVIGTRTARDAARRVGRQSFEIPYQPSSTVSGH